MNVSQLKEVAEKVSKGCEERGFDPEKTMVTIVLPFTTKTFAIVWDKYGAVYVVNESNMSDEEFIGS